MTDRRPKILAIDDMPINLNMLGAALSSEFDLQVATSGAMGLALVEKLTPDLVLLDVLMPEMDGYEVCRRLKADPKLRSIPVIFITALSDSESESSGLALGAADYITKPINVDIARQRIHNLLERERLRREVEAQRDHLDELLHAKTRFLAAAGHDLRQPITAATFLVTALKLTSQNEQQSEMIHRLDESMKVFSNMLERLLDISKFDAGLIKPEITTFNLVDLIMWFDGSFAQAALDKKLRFRLFFPVKKLPIVRIDFCLVQSVLMNLVTNAIKFTERGGILISARIRGDNVLVQVWDTGIGIAETDIPYVFDEFYQVANPQRSRSAGLGLGLSICKRAMALLGDKITCRSNVGRGTVFEFSLPLDVEHQEIKPPFTDNMPIDEVANGIFFKDKRVVLVEDDRIVAQAMISLLEGMGGEIKCFHSAEDAMGSADIENADYFIVDYMLGGEHNGIQFLNQIHQRSGKPIKALMISGDTSADLIRKSEMSGWPLLHKPVDILNLMRILQN